MFPQGIIAQREVLVAIRHNIQIRGWGGPKRWARWSNPPQWPCRAPWSEQTPARRPLDQSPTRTRDAAIFAVLYIGGIRRSELAGLDVADWTPAPPTLRIRHDERRGSRHEQSSY